MFEFVLFMLPSTREIWCKSICLEMFNNNAENQKLFLIFGQCCNISKNQRQLKVNTKTLDYILRSKRKKKVRNPLFEWIWFQFKAFNWILILKIWNAQRKQRNSICSSLGSKRNRNPVFRLQKLICTVFQI